MAQGDDGVDDYRNDPSGWSKTPGLAYVPFGVRTTQDDTRKGLFSRDSNYSSGLLHTLAGRGCLMTPGQRWDTSLSTDEEQHIIRPLYPASCTQCTVRDTHCCCCIVITRIDGLVQQTNHTFSLCDNTLDPGSQRPILWPCRSRPVPLPVLSGLFGVFFTLGIWKNEFIAALLLPLSHEPALTPFSAGLTA
ncbi:hypothetical protein TESG_06562 [Trichophyton tonsurans CBS 112818]|uniref:Uncharacterized protein n=1 Tax=Trichophyton tonsurans (strain CBS 112818) TaxID=647933 RepID=F2S6U4_TRIT1|nr:hypothetical protein TESG_06562 [Trichophyton tonsurans CBS 112818]